MSMNQATRRYLQLVAIVFVMVGVAMLLSGDGAHGQSSTDASTPTPPPVQAKADASKESPKLQALPEEEKDLKIAQLSAQLAQSAFSQKSQTLPEFGQFQQSLVQLQAECNRVIAKHKWPAGTVCDVQQVPIKFCSALPCKTDVPTAAPAK